MILDGRDRFYQWDLDRKLIVTDESIDEVHFCNRTNDCSLVCEVYQEGELRLVNVPNILLQKDWRINVYAFDGSYTKVHEIFEVERRTKPADYIYTETEIKNYDDLAARVAQIEENGISDEAIETAVERYLDENDIKVDLTGYATETYVDEKIEQIELTPGPEGKPGKDGQDYVLTDEDKAEIAGMVEVTGGSGEVDLTGYATEEYVDSKWEGYPDKQDVATKGYVTSSITGRGYITSEQAQDKIDSAIAGIEHPAPDLTGYATENYVDEKVGAIEIPEVPSLEGYATEQYVDDAIAAIDIPSGGGGSSSGSVEEVYVGTEAPDDANIKIWVDTDEEANFPNREEIQNEVFADAMQDMLNHSYDEVTYYAGITKRNMFNFAKAPDAVDNLTLSACLTAVSVDCRTNKEMAIRRLKQGLIIRNSFGSTSSSQYTISPSEVNCVGCTSLYDETGSSNFTNDMTIGNGYYFIYGDRLYCVDNGSAYRAIPYFNRIIFNNNGTSLAATDMQAAIVELSNKSVFVDDTTIIKNASGALQTALPYLSGTNPAATVLHDDNVAAEGGYYSIDSSGYCTYGMIPKSAVIAYDGNVVYVQTTISGVTVMSKMKVMSGYNSYLQAVDENQPCQYVSGSRYTFNKTYAPGNLQHIVVYSANPVMEDPTKIPSDCVVLTSPNGTMYQLSVADDGTLTTKLFS